MDTTCSHCGYQRVHCQCGRPRNTSGQPRMYQNYNDYRGEDDYAVTSRINRTSAEQRKIMEELLPYDTQLLSDWLKQAEIAEEQLTKNAVHHHLYGTKKAWACHTTSRYCFICVMAQYINTHRSIYMLLGEKYDLAKIRIHVTYPEQDQHGLPPRS